MALKCSMIMAEQVTNRLYCGFNRYTIENRPRFNIILNSLLPAFQKFKNKIKKKKKQIKLTWQSDVARISSTGAGPL